MEDLNQASRLMKRITAAGIPQENLWETLMAITEPQARLLWALVLKGDVDKLKQTIPDMQKFYSIKQENNVS